MTPRGGTGGMFARGGAGERAGLIRCLEQIKTQMLVKYYLVFANSCNIFSKPLPPPGNAT